MNHTLLLELKKWLPRPLLWVLWGLCCLVVSLFFYRLCVDYLHLSHKALAQDTTFPSVTFNIIKPLSSWSIILFSILLPIFTTSAFSQEYRQRSFTMWALSPHSSHRIVWGKFLCILLFPLSIIIVQIMMLSALAFETPLEMGSLISSSLAMLLISACLIAFGLFISSLMNNPLMAMTLTFVGTLVWMLLEWLNPFPTYFSALSQHLCLLSHSYHLLNGAFFSTDIAFFGISILFWLMLTQQVIHHKMSHYHVA